jgi:hypothetical protein
MGVKKDLKLKGSEFSHPPTGTSSSLFLLVPNLMSIFRVCRGAFVDASTKRKPTSHA